MDPNAMQAFLKSFQDMAKANQDMVNEINADRADRADRAQEPPNNRNTAIERGDNPGAVAIAGIKVPLDMGTNAEERLVNFHIWMEEIADKMTVAGITDDTKKTTIALMWGGRDIKTFAVDKANVILQPTDNAAVDTWADASKKIEKAMEEQINEAFAMFKFRQMCQDQQSLEAWYKKLRSAVKTLQLGQCTCGLGYTEERAIRDVMVELTNDSKLRKDALAKDLSLEALLKEGEANELARSRATTIEKKVMKMSIATDE